MFPVKSSFSKDEFQCSKWDKLKAETQDTKAKVEVQNNTDDEEDENEDGDGEWEDISRIEVNNCSSDYYKNYIRERPIEKGEWSVVTEVSKGEWIKLNGKAKGKRAVTATAANCSEKIKGLVSDVQKRLVLGKPKVETSSDENYVVIDSDGEWEDAEKPLPPQRSGTPSGCHLIRSRAAEMKCTPVVRKRGVEEDDSEPSPQTAARKKIKKGAASTCYPFKVRFV
ncbi:hypothetical protein Daesc_003155 [Daldinia eschscholtzii]|uniref:Uncharacterized protein n=1 Tax=Daldinia eschscholtzii TaxID=292717 RepID=A0AAX6MSB9_9PEZI